MPGDSGDPLLSRRSWTEAASLLAGPRPAVALLPVGSTEPHGPHLPLDTDVIISVETARRAAARLSTDGLTALLLPPLAYTVTEFSRDFAGAVGVSAATLRALVEDVCEAALGQGFAAVCLVNSHLEPDHLSVLRDAAAAVGARAGRPVIFPDKTRRRWAATLTAEFQSGACHAGQYETSLVMAARPDLVDEDARRALPANPVSIGRRIKEGARTFREAGSAQAYFGDPAAASAAEGHATFEALAAMVATEVLEALGR
jgi:creatinine amidohydrolase